jgi:hypothetical protein
MGFQAEDAVGTKALEAGRSEDRMNERGETWGKLGRWMSLIWWAL